jgi:hypothetical protein
MITNEDETIKLELLDHKMIPDTHIFKVRVQGEISDKDLLTACDNRSLTDKTVRHFGGFVRNYADFKEVHVFFN